MKEADKSYIKRARMILTFIRNRIDESTREGSEIISIPRMDARVLCACSSTIIQRAEANIKKAEELDLKHIEGNDSTQIPILDAMLLCNQANRIHKDVQRASYEAEIKGALEVSIKAKEAELLLTCAEGALSSFGKEPAHGS